MQLLCKMMQNQITEKLIPNSTGESSVNNEVHNTAVPMVIDFDNIEHILDFGASSSAEIASTSVTERPPRRHKITAKDPVKLLELKPVIDRFVNDKQTDSEEDEDDHETEHRQKRRFQCFVCGNQFVRSTHLQRHMRIHTGAKPYACNICKKPFSRSDYMTAHTRRHYTEKIHCCCVCGEVYTNLEEFSQHCHTHDDSDYMQIEMSRTAEKNKGRFKKSVLVGNDPVPVTTAAEEIVLNACVTPEKVDNSTVEAYIVYTHNPLYLPHQQEATAANSNDVSPTTSINEASSSANNAIH